jgi:hypothetical protein
MKRKTKPECFCCYWHIDEGNEENAPSILVDRAWGYSSEDARRLAAWLLKAAEWMESKD